MTMTTASGLTELISTDEDNLAAAPGHDINCIEHALEELTEEAAAAGVILVGDIVETFRRETLGALARVRCETICRCED